MAESHREEIAKLEALYSNNPEGRVFTHLAEAYRKAGELDRAQEILERGLERHPDYASAHVVLGRVRMDLGDPAAAKDAFGRVLELDRHNLIALRSLGELASSADDPAEALRYYRELLSLDPADDRLRLTVMRLEEEAEAAVDWEAEVGAEREALPGDLGALAADARPSEAEAAEAQPAEPEAIDVAAFAPPEEVAPAASLAGTPAAGESVTAEPPAPWQTSGAGVPQEGVVLTETIAELYSAQGLHSRAADVYRSLLQRDPGDARLEERLRESEAALERASRPVPVSEAGEEEAASWVEHVESAWTGGGGVAGAGPTPYAWTDTAQAEETAPGARIGDYFHDLLAWRPTGEAAPAEAEPAPADETLIALEAGEDVAGAHESLAREAGAASGDGTVEEDEDLEMFRSWLQSLKK